MLPDALGRALGQILDDYRRAVEKEHEKTAAESRAIIAELRAEVANLKVANEMLRVDTRRSVDFEIERMHEITAKVKDGRDGVDGKDGRDGLDGKDIDPELAAKRIDEAIDARFTALPVPKDGRDGVDGKDGRDGVDGAPGLQGEMGLPGERGEQGATGPSGKDGRDGLDGKDADPEFVVKLVDETVADAFAALPVPKDGRDGIDGKDGAPGQEGPAGRDGSDGKPGEKGADGKDADPDAIINAVLKQIPTPKDGAPGQDGKDAEEVDYAYLEKFSEEKIRALMPNPEKGDTGPAGPAGPEGRPGKDAADFAGAFRTHDGKCVLTLTDGRVMDLGVIQGKDGAPGRDGIDGKNGQDGKDGLSFDAFDLEPEYDGERTLRLKWLNSAGQQQMREWLMPVMIYREVWRPDVQYHAGDTVTYGGSLWIAKKDTQEKPDVGNGDWRLAAKHGRDGRDGKDGAKGERGSDGRPGRDFTLGGS